MGWEINAQNIAPGTASSALSQTPALVAGEYLGTSLTQQVNTALRAAVAVLNTGVLGASYPVNVDIKGNVLNPALDISIFEIH